MRHLKATAVGLTTGVLAAVLWLAGNLFLPAAWDTVASNMRGDCCGIVSTGYVGSGSTLLVLFAGFVGGFYWSLKRSRRSTTGHASA